MGSSHPIKHKNECVPHFSGGTVVLWLALLLNEHARADDVNPLEDENRAVVNTSDSMKRTEERKLSIKKDEDTIEALLFLPDHTPETTPPPVYVLASAMGCNKEGSSKHAALQFQRKGAAAITFDYRGWGTSSGLPRHVVTPGRQVEDLRAVVDHVVDTGGLGGLVDPSRIHLVGVSLGGGHVLALAAEIAQDNSKLLKSVRTVTAVAPYLHPIGYAKTLLSAGRFTRAVQLVAVIFADLIADIFDKHPVYIDFVGPSDGSQLSVLQVEGEDLEWWQKLNGNGRPIQVAARSLFYLNKYRPIDSVSHIETPTLFVMGERDTLGYADLIKEAATRINEECFWLKNPAETATIPTSHFGFLTYPIMDQVVDKILAFTVKWEEE